MKDQIGNKEKKRPASQGEGENQAKGIGSKAYYLDVIFIQILLLLLLYGVAVLVVPKLT